MSGRRIVHRLRQHRQAQLYRLITDHGIDVAFRTVEGRADGVDCVNGRPTLMLASNDYLGLRWDPRVVEGARAAARRFGSTAGGSRFMAGNIPLHYELEERLAELTGRETALLFPTGYQTNVGTLSALLGPSDTVLIERDAHASLVDGCRLAGARLRRFRRARPGAVREQLERLAPVQPAAVIADSVYSMDGDQLDVAGFVEQLDGAPESCALVDEAHAIGVFGEAGGGLLAGSARGRRVDLVVGTLSKALASSGGFLAGERDAVDAVRACARSGIFSTASTPAALGAALASLDVLASEPERMEAVRTNGERLRVGLRSEGIDVGASSTPIVPAIAGDDMSALSIGSGLLENGVCAGVAVPPAVPKGRALIRFSVTAGLTRADVERVVEVTAKLFSEAGPRPQADALA